MQAASTIMLTASCQAGTPVAPSRSMVNTGAENGKILKAIQTGLLGKSRSKETNQNGATANIEYIPASPCPSWTVEVIEAIPADKTANNP